MSTRHTPTAAEAAVLTAILAGSFVLSAAPAQAATSAVASPTASLSALPAASATTSSGVTASPTSSATQTKASNAVQSTSTLNSVTVNNITLEVEQIPQDPIVPNQVVVKFTLTTPAGPLANTSAEFALGSTLPTTRTLDENGSATITFVGFTDPVASPRVTVDATTLQSPVPISAGSFPVPLQVSGSPTYTLDASAHGVTGPALLVPSAVVALPGLPAVTGTLTFFVDGQVARTTAVTSSSNVSPIPVTYAVPINSSGNKTISVTYSGNYFYKPSSISATPVSVPRGWSITSSTTDATAYQSGTPITVNVLDTFGLPYDGTATFSVAGNAIAANVPVSNGKAVLDSNLLTSLGTTDIMVTVAGTGELMPLLGAIRVNIGQAPTSVTATGSFTQVKSGQKIKVSVKNTAGTAALAVNRGTVEVYQAEASASASSSGIPAGATFMGSATLTPSSGGNVTVSVSPKAGAGNSFYFRYQDSTGAYKSSTASQKFTQYVPLNSVKATISGTAKIGSTLTAHTTTNVPATSTKYQWLANGVVISGATGKSFTLTTAHVGKSVTVRVTSSNGSETVSATSTKTATVPKSAAKLTVKSTAKTVKINKKVTLKVKLTTPNVTSAKGTIKVKVGKKVFTKKVTKPGTYTFTVKASQLGKGKKTFTATYTPSSATAKYVTTPKKASTKVTIK